MRVLALCALAVTLVFVACTSPVDINTLRTVSVTAPHVPLSEPERVRSRSAIVAIFEGDQPLWMEASNSELNATFDTTFHPPLYWFNGVANIDVNHGPGPEIIRSAYFALDTMTAGVSGPLRDNQFRIFAARKYSSTVKYDTLNVDSLSAHLASAYIPGTRTMTDTIFFHVRSLGSGGDAGMDGKAIIRTTW